jgi:hypothetical protein
MPHRDDMGRVRSKLTQCFWRSKQTDGQPENLTRVFNSDDFKSNPYLHYVVYTTDIIANSAKWLCFCSLHSSRCLKQEMEVAKPTVSRT